MPPRVSIITPAFNVAGFIAETIASVQAQTCTQWELLIGDDGSSDGTADAAEKAAAGDPRIRVFRYPPSGLPAVPRNRLLREASAPIIAFLDSDDLWEPTKLVEQLAAIDAGAAWCFTNSRFFGGGAENPDGNSYPASWRPSRPFYEELLATRSVPFLTVLAKRELLEAIHPERQVFETRSDFKAREDWDLVLQLARQAEPAYLPTPLAGYRQHGGGVSKAGEAVFIRSLAVLEKHRKLGAPALPLQRGKRLQLSKLALHRMLSSGERWRRILLANTLPPGNLRDAFMALLCALPLPLARALYRLGIARARG